MASVKSAMKTLYGSKLGKILPVIAIAVLVSSASAAVFVNYYAHGTATAQSNNVSLLVGGDSQVSCTGITPCVSVTVTGGDYAAITMNLGIESSQSPQPQTYFTDPLQISNGGSTARNVTTIITSATQTGTFYGSLTIYYCTSSPGHNDPATVAGCTGHAITANVASPVTVASGVSLPASSKGYIALVGWASAAASSLTFDLQFQWA